MADDRVNQYAKWLVANKDKRGTPEFETVSSAYKQLRSGSGGETLSEREKYIGQTASIADLGLGIGDEFLAGVGSVFDPEGGDYSTQLNEIRSAQQKYARLDPAGYFGRQIVGGLPLAVATGGGATALAAKALPNAGNVARAAAVGSMYGGAAGFGSGEGGIEKRLQSAGVGAAVGGVLGGTFEAVVSPVASNFIQWARGRPNMITPQGTLTPQGARAAQEAGLDINEASAALRKEFGKEAQTALNPAEGLAVAEARTLPVPVPLRQGQATLNPQQQMWESEALKGSYGTLAQTRIAASEAAQQEALRANTGAIQTRLGGGQVQEAGQGVAKARDLLIGAADTAKKTVNALYTEARKKAGGAFILGRNVSEGLATIKNALNEDGLTVRTAKEVHDLLDTVGRDLLATSRAVGREPNISVANIYGIRQELSAMSQQAGAAGTAAGKAKRALDAFINDAITQDLIGGDKAVVELWRKAIAARRDFGVRFGSDDFVGKLVARKPGGGAELKLDPVGAVNLIFGQSKTGFVQKSDIFRGLARMKAELTKTPDGVTAWNALREEAFLRFVRAGQGANTPTGRDFSGGNFAKAWENALKEGPEVIRQLFTREEVALINQFARVANRVTTPVKGGQNFSNTSAALTQTVRKMFTSAFMGPRAAAIFDSLPLIKGLQSVGADMRALAATNAQIARGVPNAGPLTGMARDVPLAVIGQQGGRF